MNKKDTSYNKIKAEKGIDNAFQELFFGNVTTRNFIESQRLMNECRDLSSTKKKSKE